MRPRAEQWWLSLAGIGLCIEPVKSLKSGVVCAPSSFESNLNRVCVFILIFSVFQHPPGVAGALFFHFSLDAGALRRGVSGALCVAPPADRCPEPVRAGLRVVLLAVLPPAQVCSGEPAESPVRCASHALAGGWALLRAALELESADAAGLEWRVRYAMLLATD